MSLRSLAKSPLLFFILSAFVVLTVPFFAHADPVYQTFNPSFDGGYSYPATDCYMPFGDPENSGGMKWCVEPASNPPAAFRAEGSGSAVTSSVNVNPNPIMNSPDYGLPVMLTGNPVSNGGTLYVPAGSPVVLSWSMLPSIRFVYRYCSNVSPTGNCWAHTVVHPTSQIIPQDTQGANFSGFWAGYGQVTVYPTEDTTYSITGTMLPTDDIRYISDGESTTCGDSDTGCSTNEIGHYEVAPHQFTLSVNVHVIQPQTMSLWADSNMVDAGQSTDVHWRASGYSNCTAYRSNGQYWEVMNGDVNTGGLTEPADYDLYCWGVPGDDSTRVGPIRQSVGVRPSAPASMTATCFNGGNGVHLAWPAASGATTYMPRVDYGPNNNSSCTGGWLCDADDWYADNYNNTGADLSIHPGQAYHAWVAGQNSSGVSSGVADVYFSCDAPPGIPPAPTNLSYACSPAGTSVTITWSSGGGSTVKYDPRFNDRTNDKGSNWYVANSNDWYTDNDPARSVTRTVVPGETYDFWVHGVNSNNEAGNPSSITVSCSSGQPNPPASVTGSCSTNNVLTLSWTPPNSGAAPTYYSPRLNSNAYTSVISCPSVLPIFASSGGWGTCYSDHFTGTSLSFTAPSASFGAWVYSGNQYGVRDAYTQATPFSCPGTSSCPANQHASGNACACDNGGSASNNCAVSCPAGQHTAGNSNNCVCDNGGSASNSCAVSCPAGQQPNLSGSCVCSNGATNPSACTSCPVGSSMVSGQCAVTQGSIQSFIATPPRVRTGESATLSWATTNMKSNGCSIAPIVGSVTPNSSHSVSVDTSTTFTLSCTGLDNVVYTSTATVSLIPVIKEI